MYSADLSYVHDAGFGGLARGAAPAVVRLLRSYGIRRDARIVELGCGSGILARVLVDAGYDVLGIDASPAMIALARDRVPGARFRVASLADARVPVCDGVVAVGEVINYVPRRTVRRVFRRVRGSLGPGGVFIFDFMASAERRTFAAKSFAGEDWALVVRAELDRSHRVLTRRMTIFRKEHGEYRRSHETHHVYVHDRAAIADALGAAGFSARMRRSYDSYRLLPGDFAVTAQKL
jgi:SAM-dependent methyltransferase